MALGSETPCTGWEFPSLPHWYYKYYTQETNLCTKQLEHRSMIRVTLSATLDA